MSDIAQLSGRELDAAVAERVMGYRWIVVNRRRKNLHDLAGRIVAFVEGKEISYTGYGKPDMPEFSSSIEAAMQVVEKMRELGHAVVIQDSLAKLPWYVVFEMANNDEDATSDSLPEAICRAALKAVDPSAD